MANNLTLRYKQMAMKWLTGNMEIIPELEKVEFSEFDSSQNDFESELANTYFPQGYTITGIVQGKTNQNNGMEYSVMYGTYENSDQTQTFGYMMILDEEYTPIQIIKQFSNGDNFGIIISLNVGNDGRFYMVEYDINGYYRFVLLNNIVVKSPTEENYQVIMRQTYRFPDQSIINTSQMIMSKHPEDARYFMVQINIDNAELKCIELVINVGSTNDWHYYTSEFPVFDPNTIKIDDMIVSWDEDNNLTFKIVTTEIEIIGAHYRQYIKYANSDTIQKNDFFVNFAIDGNTDYLQSIMKDFDTAYVTTSVVNNGVRSYNIYILNGEVPTTAELIKTYSNVIVGAIKGTRLLKNEDDIFFIYQNVLNYVGIIVDSNVYLTQDTDFQPNGSLLLMKVQKSFNLYTFFVQSGNYINKAKLIYIDKNSNFPYQDYSSMTPYYSVLYDENDTILFARTLYNKNVNGQMTISTIQVPNQFLNNVNINRETLYGQTYLELINQPDTYTKNEYEEVYFNFINTWNILNENDPNNVILNIPGATRFNQSTSGTNDYENCKATKFRLNYSDNISVSFNFNDDNIVQIDSVPPYTYRYTWDVYVPTNKTILSIDIISEDEQTTFQTIDNLNLESGKLYTLTQDVYVV